MKKEIEEQIKTLRELAKAKRSAHHWCWRIRDKMRQEAEDLEKQADELEKNKD